MRKFEKVSFDQFKSDTPFLKNHKEIYDDIVLPKRATKYSVGYDISTPFGFKLNVGESILIPTGLKVCFNHDEMFSLYIRSSLGFKYNIRLVNQVGIFESDYYNNESNEGHILAKIQNEGEKEIEFKKGERIVQGIFTKFLITDDDSSDGIRTGGIGSTNK